MTVPFWKSFSGYHYCVFLGRRWYYAGTGPGVGMQLEAYYGHPRARLERVCGVPLAIQLGWIRHGSTIAALEKYLPRWEHAQ